MDYVFLILALAGIILIFYFGCKAKNAEYPDIEDIEEDKLG